MKQYITRSFRLLFQPLSTKEYYDYIDFIGRTYPWMKFGFSNIIIKLVQGHNWYDRVPNCIIMTIGNLLPSFYVMPVETLMSPVDLPFSFLSFMLVPAIWDPIMMASFKARCKRPFSLPMCLVVYSCGTPSYLFISCFTRHLFLDLALCPFRWSLCLAWRLPAVMPM